MNERLPVAVFDTLPSIISPLYLGHTAAQEGASTYAEQLLKGWERITGYPWILVSEELALNAARDQGQPAGDLPVIILSPEMYSNLSHDGRNTQLHRSRLYLYQPGEHGGKPAIGHTNGLTEESAFGHWVAEHGPNVKIAEDSVNSGETILALKEFLESMGVQVTSVIAGYNGSRSQYLPGTQIPITAATYRHPEAVLDVQYATQVSRSLEPQDLGHFQESGPALVHGATQLYEFYRYVKSHGRHNISNSNLHTFSSILGIDLNHETMLRHFFETHPDATFAQFLDTCVSFDLRNPKFVAIKNFNAHRADSRGGRRWLTWPYPKPDEGPFKLNGINEQKHLELSLVAYDAMVNLLKHIISNTGRRPSSEEFPGLSLPTVKRIFGGLVPTDAYAAFTQLAIQLKQLLTPAWPQVGAR